MKCLRLEAIKWLVQQTRWS